MLRCSLILMCAVVASACGQTAVLSSEGTGGPSASQPLEATCITAAPGDFLVDPRNGNAYLSWSAVTTAHAYEVEIYRVDSGALVASSIAAETRLEWDAHDLGQGPYRARVRAISECGKGNWSAFDMFVLNRSGSTPSPAPPVPAPPVPPVPPPPLHGCGTVRGHYVVNLLGTTFVRGNAPVYAPLALPAGAYEVHVETNDANHRAGWQTSQTEEVVTVWGVGTTHDIPDAATRQVTTFNVMLPMLAQVVVEAGPHSVHGVCVAFVRKP